MRNFRYLLSFSLLLFAVLPNWVFAKTVQLYRADGIQKDGYDALLYGLKPGDILEFNDGARYEVIKFLGSGKVSTVLEVQSLRDGAAHSALRLPKLSDLNPKNGTRFPTVYLNYTIDAYPKLLENHVPVPKPFRSAEGQYIEMELQHPAFDFNEYFLNGKRWPLEKQEMVLEKLKDFAKKTAGYRKLGDFSGAQLVFDSKTEEWILLDFDRGSKLAHEKTILNRLGFSQFNLFDLEARFFLWDQQVVKNKSLVFNSFQKNILKNFSETTRATRKEMGMVDPCPYSSILKALFP